MTMMISFFSVIMAMTVVVITAQMVVSFTLMKNTHLYKIEEKTGNSSDEHLCSLNLSRIDNPIDGRLQKEQCDGNQEHNAGKCTNDFRSMPPIGKLCCRSILTKFQTENRHTKTDHICGKMCSICKNSYGTWEVSTDGLGYDEEYGDKWN